ncbi:MAG: hypothetical protein ACO1N7_04950 [Sphingobacteriaceae bacterium]
MTKITGLIAATFAGYNQDGSLNLSIIPSLVRCLVQFPPIPAQRAIMKMLGYDCGTCRLPLRELSAKESEALKAGLDAINFFEVVNSCPVGNMKSALVV